MKKTLSLLLALVLCIVLCACGGDHSQFTVTCKDGTTETMTMDELSNVASNELKYKQKYSGAHVSGKAKIESIETSIMSSKGHIEAVDIGFGRMDVTLTDVPSDYAVSFDLGDTITISGTISKTSIGWIEIRADDFYKQDTNSEDQSKAVYDGLSIAKEELESVKKYAGNVNGSGSRKFADEFIEELRNALANVDIEYVNSTLPQTASLLHTIQSNITTVTDLLVDMGNTNSDENVPQMKQLAEETIAIIDDLFDSELSAYDY